MEVKSGRVGGLTEINGQETGERGRERKIVRAKRRVRERERGRGLLALPDFLALPCP